MSQNQVVCSHRGGIDGMLRWRQADALNICGHIQRENILAAVHPSHRTVQGAEHLDQGPADVSGAEQFDIETRRISGFKQYSHLTTVNVEHSGYCRLLPAQHFTTCTDKQLIQPGVTGAAVAFIRGGNQFTDVTTIAGWSADEACQYMSLLDLIQFM